MPSRADTLSRRVLGHPVGGILPGGRPITITPQRPTELEREALPHFWHPNRSGVEVPPDDFVRRLRDISPSLSVVRPPPRAPVLHCWYLWRQEPRVHHRLCPGWFLLLAWKYGSRPLPLNEAFFAALYFCDPRHMGKAVEYFDRVTKETADKKARQWEQFKSDSLDRAREWKDYTKIKNIGPGSRFARHHDGTILPTKGEVSWSLERTRQDESSDLRRERERSRG